MKKSLLSVTLLALMSVGLSSCIEMPILYSEEGTTWIVEGGERPTGHIGGEVDETTSESDGDEETTPSEHTEHTWDEGVVTKEATCTEEGEITYTCLECEETYTAKIEIDPNNHDYVSTETEPTCGEDGYITYVCSRCGDTQYESSGKTATGEHSYVISPSEIDPSSGHIGTCTICGEVSILEEHSYEYISTDSDTHILRCLICGYEEVESHSLILVDDENGETHHEECEYCDYKASSEPHEYEISKDSEGATHSGRCACGAEYLAEGHTYIYEPVTGGNTHKISCALCDYEEYESHYMISAEHSDGAHTSICICGAEYETKENATYYSVTDEYIHTEVCTMCDYSVEGDHTNKDQIDGNCTVCGFSAGLEYVDGSSGLNTYLYDYGTYTGTELVFPNSYDGKVVKGTSGGGAFGMPNDATASTTYVRIPKSMVKIGSYDFINSPYIEKVEFEEGSQLESIGYDAFSYTKEAYVELNSTSFTELHLPSTVTTLGDNAFCGRQYLETITFGEDSQLESIGKYCFYDCHSLKEITIPSGITEISDYAFSNCYSLKSLTIPAGVKTIGKYAFYECPCLTSLTFEEGSQLETIGAYAFRGCTSLESIVIPASVKTIGDSAFRVSDGASGLKSITFEEGSQLETIEQYAFRGCTNLESIVIPKSVKTIGDCAFRNGDSSYSALKSVTFEEGIQLETINYCAFYFCYSLESIAIPESVKTIGDYAFYKCYSLTSLTFEEDSNLESIGGQAFGYCRSLESLTIPSSVSEIGQFAFYGGTSLTSLTFEEDSKLDTIGYAAFDDSALTEVTVPASVTTLSDWAFGDSESLREVTIEGSSDGTSQLTTLGAAFAGDTALETVTLPGSITTITDDDGEYLFTGCTSLTTINFYGTQDQWNSLVSTGLLGLGDDWSGAVNCLGSGN